MLIYIIFQVIFNHNKLKFNKFIILIANLGKYYDKKNTFEG